MSIDTKESLRIFLTQQLKDVEGDIETINPPEDLRRTPETARVAVQVS